MSGEVQNGTSENASVGAVVRVKARPKPYLAKIESDRWGRLTVRPLPGQDVTERSRAVWRQAILEVCNAE